MKHIVLFVLLLIQQQFLAENTNVCRALAVHHAKREKNKGSSACNWRSECGWKLIRTLQMCDGMRVFCLFVSCSNWCCSLINKPLDLGRLYTNSSRQEAGRREAAETDEPQLYGCVRTHEIFPQRVSDWKQACCPVGKSLAPENPVPLNFASQEICKNMARCVLLGCWCYICIICHAY